MAKNRPGTKGESNRSARRILRRSLYNGAKPRNAGNYGTNSLIRKFYRTSAKIDEE